MKNSIAVFSSNTENSKRTESILLKKIDNLGLDVTNKYEKNTNLIICIGGDGTFLDLVHKLDFPKTPIMGINTGHLGFFQDIMPDRLDDFIFNYTQGNYKIQNLLAVKSSVKTDKGSFEHHAVNEIVIRGDSRSAVHLNISIDGQFIERFSGDGVLISSAAGSTAYNYSLGGSIVDPRLRLLQVTPMAPMNTSAYRSFTSSLLLPGYLNLGITPDFSDRITDMKVLYDGISTTYNSIEEVNIILSDKSVNLLRFDDYDFWTKVKSKFL